MKKSIILAIALVMSVATFAQQLATLNHNDSITVYYGMNALQQAHASAVNGDIITLSSGIFNSVNITKAVTIRGAGAWTDTNGNSNTILYNNFTLNVSNDPSYNLVIEGVFAMNSITFNEAHNPRFIKCHFIGLGPESTQTMMYNANFINCIVEGWTSRVSSMSYSGSYNYTYHTDGTQFLNSVILESGHGSEIFTNCVIKQEPGTISGRLYQNCILYYPYSYSSSPSNVGGTAFNCMYINTSTSSSVNIFSNTANHVLWNKSGMSTVFKNFDGTYGSTTTFELQDSIAANYLGLDGTQIGIYGGLHPFSQKVTNPAIKRINVAQRNNSEGKLEVSVEMVTEEE